MNMKLNLIEYFHHDIDNEDYDEKELFENLIDDNSNWPELKDEDGYNESVCTENLKIENITENTITVIAGGDWQNPTRIKLELSDSNMLQCIATEYLDENGN